MRVVTLVAFLAVAFTAVAAAPHAQTSVVHVKSNVHVGVKAISEDLLLDLISLIIGADVREIIAQTEATITGLEALLDSSSNELLSILESGGAGAVAEAERILTEAVAEAKEIVRPIVRLIETLVNLISRRNLPQNLIEDLVKYVVNQIVNLIDGTITGLEALVGRTAQQLLDLARSSGQSIATQVEALVTRTLAEGLALVEPLLKLLEPLIPSTEVRVNDWWEDFINDIINDIIEHFPEYVIRYFLLVIIDYIHEVTGISMIVLESILLTINALARLSQEVLRELEQVVGAGASELVSQAKAILAAASAQAEPVVTKVLNLLQKLKDGGNPVILVPLLLIALESAQKQLPPIIEAAVAELATVASQLVGETRAQVEQILKDAVAYAKAIIQDLLDTIKDHSKKQITLIR